MSSIKHAYQLSIVLAIIASLSCVYPAHYAFANRSGSWEQSKTVQITNGTPVTVNLALRQQRSYRINVPSGSSSLTVTLTTTAGSLTGALQYGRLPSGNGSCSSFVTGGFTGTCAKANPTPGNWYIAIQSGATAATGTLRADYQQRPGATGAATPLVNGLRVLVSLATGQARYYYIDVPNGRSSLSVSISGSGGYVLLYTRHGSMPTTTSYDCVENNQHFGVCHHFRPAGGRWYIMVYAQEGGTRMIGATYTSY